MVPAKQTLIWTLQVCEEPEWQLKTIPIPNRVWISYRYTPLQSLSQPKAVEDIKKSCNSHMIAIISLASTSAPCVDRRKWNHLYVRMMIKKEERSQDKSVEEQHVRLRLMNKIKTGVGVLVGLPTEASTLWSPSVQPDLLLPTSSGGGLRLFRAWPVQTVINSPTLTTWHV